MKETQAHPETAQVPQGVTQQKVSFSPRLSGSGTAFPIPEGCKLRVQPALSRAAVHLHHLKVHEEDPPVCAPQTEEHFVQPGGSSRAGTVVTHVHSPAQDPWGSHCPDPTQGQGGTPLSPCSQGLPPAPAPHCCLIPLPLRSAGKTQPLMLLTVLKLLHGYLQTCQGNLTQWPLRALLQCCR